MKFKMILAFFSALLANISFGQVGYGFKAGLSLADQYKNINPPGFPDEKIETKLLTGFQAGGFLKYGINDKVSLVTELIFSLVGSTTKYVRTDFVVNPDGTISGPTNGFYNDKIYRVELPLLMQYQIKKFYAGAGPAIGIKISSSKYHYQNNNFKTTYYRPIDFMLSAVLGCSVTKKTGLNLQYNYGLTDNDRRNYSVVKNRALTFSVFYKLK